VILYTLRGLAIALSVFVLVYALLRVLLECGTRLVNRLSIGKPASVEPNGWYALQVAPFVTAAVATFLFAIPSFLHFEPNRMEEEFGAPVVVLSLLCLAVLGTGLYRAWLAYSRTAKTVSTWRENATIVSHERYDILETGPNTPPLAVAGLLRPKLLISSSASKALSKDELLRAIAHESTHIRNHDNIKKLILRICSVPRSSSLERKWLEAIELAADRDAVSNRREALDLASALVKASRMSVAMVDLATNFTTDTGQLLHTRVERLLAWREETSKFASRVNLILAAAIGLMAVAIVPSYQFLLLQMHYLAEFLMR
jgi:Zn-dependent protease with chaperone function